MNIRLELPHTVYLLPKKSLGKAEIQVDRLEFKPAEKKLIVEVENTGESFGRVQQTVVDFGKKKQEAPGFPIFPHRKRIMEIALEQNEPPTSVVLEFANFKVEEKVQARTAHSPVTMLSSLKSGLLPAVRNLAGDARLHRKFLNRRAAPPRYSTPTAAISVKAPNYDGSIGAGIYQGHFLMGAVARTKVMGYTVICGDDTVRFDLPTDIFGNTSYFSARG